MPLFANEPTPPAARPRPKVGMIFQGNGFCMQHPSDWQDKTIYTVTGPIEDNIQHNVIVMADRGISFDSVTEYGEIQIAALESELKACRILKKGITSLQCGVPAYQAVLRWEPSEERCIYQQQVYVLLDRTGYKLTASFTKKTRKTMGPLVEQIMLSFLPQPVSQA